MNVALLTLVCFAVKEEARFFDRRMDSRPQVRILLTGIGPRNTERTVRAALTNLRPDLVLSCGFAGGLNPELATGTILYSSDMETGLEAALRAAGARPARFHSSTRVAVTAQEKQRLRQATGDDAVEMESHVIRALCREQKIPSATVRVVLDTAAEDLPLDFNELMTPDQRVSHRKVALALMRSPSKLGGLLRLQKQSEAAAQKLAETLARALAG